MSEVKLNPQQILFNAMADDNERMKEQIREMEAECATHSKASMQQERRINEAGRKIKELEAESKALQDRMDAVIRIVNFAPINNMILKALEDNNDL